MVDWDGFRMGERIRVKATGEYGYCHGPHIYNLGAPRGAGVYVLMDDGRLEDVFLNEMLPVAAPAVGVRYLDEHRLPGEVPDLHRFEIDMQNRRGRVGEA